MGVGEQVGDLTRVLDQREGGLGVGHDATAAWAREHGVSAIAAQ